MSKAKLTYAHSALHDAPAIRQGFLFGEVSDETILPLYEQISHLEGGEYTLHLATYGGSCDFAFALIDLLRRTPVKVTTLATGTVMSMGVDLLMSGHHRQVSRATTAMIHCHSGWSSEDMRYSEMPDVVQINRMEHSRREQLYKERTRMTASQLRKVFGHRDIYLNAQQLVDYGIADEII